MSHCDQTQFNQEEQQQAFMHIRQQQAFLPASAGCYLMKDQAGVVIYVGKAKILKNRVRSYFSGSHVGKTEKLVAEVRDIECIVTSSPIEALLLECNLIKQYQPKYNVLLKDDKTFPYLKLTRERHPRLEVTRRVEKDNAKYFGPYPNAFAAQQAKKLLDRLYPLRKCNNLPDKVCLYYHIGQCLAPCVYEVTEGQYEQMVREITKFLHGEQADIKKQLQYKMEQAAEGMQFERAQQYRDQLIALQTIKEKQAITTTEQVNRDVFGYTAAKGWMCVQILYVRQGKMIERHRTKFPFYGEVYTDFLSFVTQYYSHNPALPQEILLPQIERAQNKEAVAVPCHKQTDDEWQAVEEEALLGIETLQQWLKVKVRMPKRGPKKQLVWMAVENARIALYEKLNRLEHELERTSGAVERLAEILHVKTVQRIEIFDHSHIQGTDPVAALVVFIDGKPAKHEYRKYHIRTGNQSADDYAAIREVVRRRYERVLKEQLAQPDFIIVDGGKGHISAVQDVLTNEMGLNIPVAGLSKNDKHQTAQLLAGSPPHIVPLAQDSAEFYLLQRMQAEVHRFAISFHNQRRTKSMIESTLDHIPGVGEKRRKQLLTYFGSIKHIRMATVEQLRAAGIGEKLAHTIVTTLQEQTQVETGVKQNTHNIDEQ